VGTANAAACHGAMETGTRKETGKEMNSAMNVLDTSGHLSDHDLERYHLGMVTDKTELAAIEEHYLSCPDCARRAEEVADYVDAVRSAACALEETAFYNLDEI